MTEAVLELCFRGSSVPDWACKRASTSLRRGCIATASLRSLIPAGAAADNGGSGISTLSLQLAPRSCGASWTDDGPLLVVAAYPAPLLPWCSRALGYVDSAGAAELLKALGHAATLSAFASTSPAAKALLGALLAWAIVLDGDSATTVPLEACTPFPWSSDVMTGAWEEATNAGLIDQRASPERFIASSLASAGGAVAAALSTVGVGVKRLRSSEFFIARPAPGGSAYGTAPAASKRPRIQTQPTVDGKAASGQALSAPKALHTPEAAGPQVAGADAASIFFVGSAWSMHGYRPSKALKRMVSDVLSLALARHPP